MDKEELYEHIRRMPNVYHQQLLELTQAYSFVGFGDLPPEVDERRKEFFELLAGVKDEAFFEMLHEKYGVTLSIDEKTPEELLHNKVFLDYVAKHRPSSIIFFPDDMIEDWHVKTYEEYATKRSLYLPSKYNRTMAKKLSSSKIVLDKFLKMLTPKMNIYNDGDAVNLICAVINNEEALDYVIDAIKEQGYTFHETLFRYVPKELRGNKRLMREAMEADLNNIFYFSKEDNDGALEIAKEIIENKDISVERIIKSNAIFNPEIAHLVLRKILTGIIDKPKDEIDFTDPELCNEFIPDDKLLLFLDRVDFKNLPVEDRALLYRTSKANYYSSYENTRARDTYARIINEITYDEGLLNYFIMKGEPFSLTEFDQELYTDDFSKKIIDTVINTVDGSKKYNYEGIAHTLKNNKKLINYLLDRILEKCNNCDYLIRVLEEVDAKDYDDEAFEKLLLVLEEDPSLLNSIVDKGWNAERSIKLLDTAVKADPKGEYIQYVIFSRMKSSKELCVHIIDILSQNHHPYLDSLLDAIPQQSYLDDEVFEKLVYAIQKEPAFNQLALIRKTTKNNLLMGKLADREVYDILYNYPKGTVPIAVIKKLFVHDSDTLLEAPCCPELEELESNIKLTDINEIEKVLKDSIGKENVFGILIALRDYHSLGYKSDAVEELKGKAIEKIVKLKNIEGIENVIPLILSGELKPSTFIHIENKESVQFALNIGDVNSVEESIFLGNISNEIYEKLNNKHVVKVLSLLERFEGKDKAKIALNMYLTIGLDKCIELLNPDPDKNYGPVTFEQLEKMFKGINPNFVSFKEEGNGYVPDINEPLINMIFGKNYKIKNTPIRNFLNDYEDRKKLRDENEEKINNDLNLTPEEKKDRIRKERAKCVKYSEDVETMMSKMSTAFNEWDIVEEEYLKKESKNSGLVLKLNIGTIVEIIKLREAMKNTPELGFKDEPLKQSDVFNYVGHDSKFTDQPELAPRRAVELSRMMEDIHCKKFPDVKVEKSGCKLEIINPQDREILSIGYKSNCCFRPRGNADNEGRDYSLLKYCCTEEYGGGLKITDSKGNVLMFAPILRNGNVLMIHSIETAGLSSEESKLVHEMLVEYANRTIEEAKQNGDEIDFVAITDLHNLDTRFVEKRQLSGDCRFEVYDDNNEYVGMYHNLDGQQKQYILASREGKRIPEDVYYGFVRKSYEYPDIKPRVYELSMDEDEADLFGTLDETEEQYIVLANDRMCLVNKGEKEEAYEVTKQLRQIKEKKIELLKSISEEKRAKYVEHVKAKQHISEICMTRNCDVPKNIRKCVYGNGWYIVITNDGELIGDSLDESREEYTGYLEGFKEFVSEDKIHPEGLKIVMKDPFDFGDEDSSMGSMK